MDEKKPDPKVDPRVATFLCKNCAAVNQQAFPEVRIITQKEPCKCGITEESRVHRAWSTAAGIALSILILSGFGSCVADNYFTTEQIKAMPSEYKVEKKLMNDGLGPSFMVQELSPQEKERRAMIERIKTLEKELEGKQK